MATFISPLNWECPNCHQRYSPTNRMTFLRGTCHHDVCSICIAKIINRSNLSKEATAFNSGKVVPCPLHNCHCGKFPAVGVQPASRNEIIELCDERDAESSIGEQRVTPGKQLQTEDTPSYVLALAMERKKSSDIDATQCGCREKKKSPSSTVVVAMKSINQRDSYWKCHSCTSMNSSNKKRCSSCRGWKGGKRENFTRWKKSREKKKSPPSTVGVAISHWECHLCTTMNPSNKRRCSSCRGWKGGKREFFRRWKKSNNDKCNGGSPTKTRPRKCDANFVSKTIPRSDKWGLQPLFGIGDEVYAAWRSAHDAEPAWYPGKIICYESIGQNEYGPVRLYSIKYEDGDELNEVDDYWVFPKDDYLMQERYETTGWEPIGIKKKFDRESGDKWARFVGWYEVMIDGQRRSFSRFLDALKAHDDTVVKINGNNTKKSYLNMPDNYPLLFQQQEKLELDHNSQSDDNSRFSEGNSESSAEDEAVDWNPSRDLWERQTFI